MWTKKRVENCMEMKSDPCLEVIEKRMMLKAESTCSRQLGECGAEITLDFAKSSLLSSVCIVFKYLY